ncbi:MAG: AbrB/MazE/SpoVT family DNA-binding domain-containing protein [Clostridiales Family XIII bacterium]|jgi:AbrB family looped-hinge helix DNA binding protein|nr:AbrB/MazE/SpoVT family DNA-binding domain-containing protein [Clostridiales Family XIII bacterium]
MEIAKITSKGQLTVPVDIRRKLNLSTGDKVVFVEDEGRIYFENAALLAFNKIQEAFEGEAERAGMKNDDDVMDMVKDMRREKRAQV